MTAARIRHVLALVAALLGPIPLSARTVTLPAGTVLYGEIAEQVTSRVKKEGTAVGDVVKAHVWRDVVSEGQVVVAAGAPMLVRVSDVKKAKLAGIKGRLELEAVSASAVDGSDVLLDGGYDKSGHGRKALSISLAAAVAWPLIFIHGKQAVLDSGTVFDATVQTATRIEVAGDLPRKIKLSRDPPLAVEVLYDAMDPEGKSETLPVRLRRCGGGALGDTRVVTVDDVAIEPLSVAVDAPSTEGDCTTASGSIDMKALGKHLRKGINRFEVESGGARAEVVLDIEL